MVMSKNQRELVLEGKGNEAAGLVMKALPRVIVERTIRDGKMNFSLFKSTLTSGRVKFIPHGHQRTPYLINNTMLSRELLQDLANELSMPIDDVTNVVCSIAVDAKRALSQNQSAVFKVEGLCKVYLDGGKLRVSMHEDLSNLVVG